MESTIGLKYSTKGIQTVCPTGISGFDYILGGGFPLTSINIIGLYAPKQKVLIFTPRICWNKNSRFIRELPSMITTNDNVDQNKNDDDILKIAFRYSNLSTNADNKQQQQQSNQIKFDFGQHIDPKMLDNIQFYTHDQLFSVLNDLQHSDKSIDCYRIFVSEFGSPTSCFDEYQKLPKICHKIKRLMRRLSKAVMVIELEIFKNNDHYIQYPRRMIHFECDSSFSVRGFDPNDDQNPYAKDYIGMIIVQKFPRLNSLSIYQPMIQTIDYGMKLIGGKRFLTVEKLSLPPDLGEMVNRFTTSKQASSNTLDSISF